MTGWPWFRGQRRNKTRPRVYLGTLAVAPRGDLKRFLDGFETERELDSVLLAGLRDLFTLPKASEADDPLDTDLVLDVLVPEYGGGAVFGIDAPSPSFPSSGVRRSPLPTDSIATGPKGLWPPSG